MDKRECNKFSHNVAALSKNGCFYAVGAEPFGVLLFFLDEERNAVFQTRINGQIHPLAVCWIGLSLIHI